MKRVLLVWICTALGGCATVYDARLNGSWRSNREQTVQEAFRRDPRWLRAAPERVERFKDLFGHMTTSYSNNVIVTRFKDKVDTMHYRVVTQGKDFVVIRIREGVFNDTNIRIDFTDDQKGYWIDGVLSPLREKFDKLSDESVSSK
jgi:hypothetical protein